MGNETVTTATVTVVTVTLHKLTAGDGYTYLTRQVAAPDGTERGYTSLGDYYAAKGESPGRVAGPRPGIARAPAGGSARQQMLNLFGQGIHPDAERIRQERVRRGARRVPQAFAATRLGRAFPVFEGTSDWRKRLARAVRGVEPGPRAARRTGPIPAEERTRIRTEVARAMFAEQHGREPLHPAELSGFLRPAVPARVRRRSPGST